MTDKVRLSIVWVISTTVGMCLLNCLAVTASVNALDRIPPPDPIPGAYGLEATKKQAPPTTGASITTPGSGSSFSDSPITVRGICPDGLLVQIYNNNVMVGASICEGGSFSLEVSLFSGKNELSALVFDSLYQKGPKSNVVTVTYTDTNFTDFADMITLTTAYGRRSAAAGQPLEWPLQLSGGSGPYAFSIDWGDGSDVQLKSQSLAGIVDIVHSYEKAGIYLVNIKVTDSKGAGAFLQVVAVSSGEVKNPSTQPGVTQEIQQPPEVIWIPSVISFALLAPTFWLGRMSKVTSIRNRMLRERDDYEKKQAEDES